MKSASQYVKIVEWSTEDQCFVGSCPGLFYGGCHNDDEKAVFAELCQIGEETIQLYEQEKKPLPPPTPGSISPTPLSTWRRIPEREFKLSEKDQRSIFRTLGITHARFEAA